MLRDRLEGVTATLQDDIVIEVFSFTGDKVSATLGLINQAVCAPILDLQVLGPDSLTVTGLGVAFLWEEIVVNGQQLSVIRNGKPAIYRLEGEPCCRAGKRHLP